MVKNKLILSLSASMLMALPMTAMAQGSIDIFKQAHSEAEELRQQYKNQLEKRQNKKDLVQTELGMKSNEANLKQALKEKLDYEKQSAANAKELAKAVKDYRAIKDSRFWERKTHEERVAYLKDEANGLTKKLNALRSAYDTRAKAAQTADSTGEYWEKRADAAAMVNDTSSGGGKIVNKDGISNEEAVKMALEKIGYDENRLDEADEIRAQIMHGASADDAKAEDGAEKDARQVAAEKEYNAYSIKAQYYRNLAASIYSELEGAEKEISNYEQALDQVFAYLEAEENHHNLNQEAQELKSLRADNQEYIDSLHKEKDELNKEKSRLAKVLAGEATGKYDSMSMEFYVWRTNKGYDGHQMYIPLEYYVEDKFSEYGLSTAIVSSSESTLKGMKDATLHYGYRNVHDRYVVKYSIDATLPTGKNRHKSEQLALLDDDRVPVTRLGEGLIVNPSVEIKRHDGEENVWRLRVGYQFKGDYKNDYADSGNRIHPGNVINYDLDWTRATAKYQTRLGITNESTGTGTSVGQPYRDGDVRLYKAMYNRKLSKASDLMGYFWFRHYGANMYGGSGNAAVRYYGLEYKYTIDKNRALYLYNDNMFSTGEYTSYKDAVEFLHNEGILTDKDYKDYINRFNGRKKYTLGLAYEQKLKENLMFKLGFDYYWMWDKELIKYRGLIYRLNLQGTM